MLRELMIRFGNEGEIFREISEERNYFLSEAEEIVNQIRNRLKRENRVVDPKSFELLLDGQQIVVAYVSFNMKESLEQQITKTILHYDGWEDEIKNKYVNKIKEYAELERQLLLNKELRAFVVRFDQVLGNTSTKPFPLLLTLKQLKKLFNEVYTRVTSGFYSELEEIINAVKIGYETIVLLSIDELKNKEEFSFEEMKKNVLVWFNDDAKFMKFIQYAVACYQSVSQRRIDALCSRSSLYQNFQSYLFKECVPVHGFERMYEIHEKLLKKFDKKFNDILFEGFVLTSDEMVESLVIVPVIKKFQEDVKKIS